MPGGELLVELCNLLLVGLAQLLVLLGRHRRARQGQGEFTVGVRNTSPMKSASVSPQTITVTIQEEGE